MESPFEVLGVDPEADTAAVVDAYRERVKEVHPDHGGSQAEFQRVQDAYEQIRSVAVAPDDVSDRPENGTGPKRNGDQPSAARSAGPSNREPTAGTRTNGEPESAATTCRVEFLNYEAVVDQGWDIGDDDLFEKAADADLPPEDWGRVLVEPEQTLLEAAEERGFSWPFACRGGACANCAVAVVEGEVEMPANHVLTDAMVEEGVRLSCISVPVTTDMKVIYNLKHLPGLDELRLPPQQFGRADTV